VLFASEVKVLGWLVGSKGQFVEPSRIEALSDIPRPKTKRQLRKLLAWLMWISPACMQPSFSELTAPL
jgi:hypothetical protein